MTLTTPLICEKKKKKNSLGAGLALCKVRSDHRLKGMIELPRLHSCRSQRSESLARQNVVIVFSMNPKSVHLVAHPT
jgi:hypothetical protein